MNAGHLTVRNVPDNVIGALQEVQRRRGTSLNQTVIDLLSQALGVGRRRRSGLSKFAGTWTEPQLRDFEEATAVFEKIDPEFWR